jgi:hypothetical protein
MPEETMTTEEEQRIADLNRSRFKDQKEKDFQNQFKVSKVANSLSFFQKISQHWLILFTAALFDILALIPGISFIFNAIFGFILFLYFGAKKKSGGSELLKIFLPVAAGSLIDLFISVLPVNIGAALIRIALS